MPQSEARAYELIWQRAVAPQMTDCTGETVTLKLGATARRPRRRVRSVRHRDRPHGLPEVYEETKVQDDSEDDADERRPHLVEGDAAAPLARSSSRGTPRLRRVASRRRRSSNASRNSALGVRRPTHRSSAPSRIAATSGRRVRPRAVVHRLLGGQRHGRPPPTSSTTPSPPRWRTTSTRSPPVPRRPSRGSAASTSVR